MQTKGDGQLLREYVEQDEESSFAEIVARHTNLVYSAALRQVGSTDLAADVTQSAFLALAQSASSLCKTIDNNASLAGWLCRSARNVSMNMRRSEFRRQSRERQFMGDSNASSGDEPDWEQIRPVLDEAMSELNEPDYDALVLRFFKNQDFRQVGTAMGVNDDTAQKRVSRALEKLRLTLSRRGIRAATVSLTALLSTNAVHSAPAGLATMISSAAALAGAASLSSASVATGIIAMTTIQKTLVGVVLAAAVGTAIYQGQQAFSLRQELLALEQTDAHLQQAYHHGRNKLQGTANQLAAIQQENAGLKGARSKPPQTVTARIPDVEAPPAAEVKGHDLPKESWGDVGFDTPEKALQTRGWAVSSGNRERFKESVFVTDGARQTLEDMFVRMVEASQDPNKAQYVQQILDNDLDVEDGILMPMMAENRQKGYVGYRILSQDAPSPDQTIVQLEIQMSSGTTRKETLKFRRIDNAWKVVIDEEFIQANQQ